jgi:hypothetical protein
MYFHLGNICIVFPPAINEMPTFAGSFKKTSPQRAGGIRQMLLTEPPAY